MNEDVVTDKLSCRCKHALFYSGYMVTLPTKLYLKKGENLNYTGLNWMLFGWFLFAFILAYAFKSDFENILTVIIQII